MKIEKNAAWLSFEDLFTSDYAARYNWFLFEFGKRITYVIYQKLLGKVSQIKGTEDYKKRLVMAEMRDQGSRYWFAIAAKSKGLSQSEYDSKKTILTVVPRYKLGGDNPISQILVKFGPWTAESLPFLPLQRQAMVVLQKAGEAKVEEVLAQNKADSTAIQAALIKNSVDTDTRTVIYQKLKIIPDWEVEALRLEFGMSEGGLAHWRPAIKYGRREGLSKVMTDQDLIRAMTDPSFTGYTKQQHVEIRMNQYEMRHLERFQKVIRKGL